MKVGDRVTRDKVMRTNNPLGSIININDDYVVVDWDNINGHWHYTHVQTKSLTIVTETSVDK